MARRTTEHGRWEKRDRRRRKMKTKSVFAMTTQYQDNYQHFPTNPPHATGSASHLLQTTGPSRGLQRAIPTHIIKPRGRAELKMERKPCPMLSVAPVSARVKAFSKVFLGRSRVRPLMGKLCRDFGHHQRQASVLFVSSTTGEALPLLVLCHRVEWHTSRFTTTDTNSLVRRSSN